MDEGIVLAIIGGSGLYKMPVLSDIREIDLETPFGKPSSPIVIGSFEEKRLAFLARHGVGHQIMPAEVNYRANIYALKAIGASRIISVSACGSLREDFAPGHIVIPNQLYDNTKGRISTFFGDGLVSHIGVANPFCHDLSSWLEQASVESKLTIHRGGTFITIEGPRFSTKAESNTYRSWGMSIIGMTTSPEAYLAREAELCYAVMAHVTDYDVWHTSEAPVTVEMIIDTLNKNIEGAQSVIRKLIAILPEERTCECKDALSSALITDQKFIPAETKQKLNILIEKYIK